MLTTPRQEGASIAGDPDHQVWWPEGECVRIYPARGARMWVHGGTSGDETPPLAPSAVDGPPRPPTSLV